jgi:hypothetical protein
MTRKENKNIDGWLPKDPTQPQKTCSNPKLHTPSNHLFAKIGGPILSAIGVFLISVYTFGYFYTYFLLDYSNSILNIRWLFYLVYVFGIGIAITGLMLRQLFISKSELVIKKRSFWVGGIACFSVSVIGSLISTEMITQFAMTHTDTQYSNASLNLNYPFWFSIISWVVGFAGWILVLWARKGLEWSSLTKATFGVLSAGVLLLFVNVLNRMLTLAADPTRSAAVSSVLNVSVPFAIFFAVPVGTLLLTCGWIFLLTSSLKLKIKTDEATS